MVSVLVIIGELANAGSASEQRHQSGLKSGGRGFGVTGQNIPPAGVYPGI